MSPALGVIFKLNDLEMKGLYSCKNYFLISIPSG